MKGQLVLLSTIILLFISCGNEEVNSEGPTTSHSVPLGHFRGISIGDAMDVVLKREPIDSVVFSIPNQVMYNIGTDTCVLQVSYEFEEDTLHTIQADWFFLEEVDLEQMAEEIRTSFDNKYARQEGQGDFEVWKSVNAEGEMVEFTMMDASTEYGRPVLSLTIYDSHQ